MDDRILDMQMERRRERERRADLYAPRPRRRDGPGVLTWSHGELLREGVPMQLDTLRRREVWWVQGSRRGQDVPLSPAGWLDLARAIRYPCPHVEIFGRSETGGQPGPSDITGLKARLSEDGSSILLPVSSLGDLTAGEADAAEVYSATHLARQIVARSIAGTGEPTHPIAASAAACSLWSGPMACYEGSAPWVHVYDQRRSFLAAWDQPMARPGAEWRLAEGGEAERAALDPDAVGFALVAIRTAGESYLPAALGGDVFRAPVAGRSVIPVSIWALRDQLLSAGLDLDGVVACAWTRPAPRVSFREEWEAAGARKSVYQRAFSAIDPGQRWIGRFRADGTIRWTEQAPREGAMPEIAALGRWATASKTAALLMRLHRIGHPVVNAHIDSVFVSAHEKEVPGRGLVPHHDPAGKWTGELPSWDVSYGYDDGFTAPNSVSGWALKSWGMYRGYGPGRYDLTGVEHPTIARMGGGGLDAEDGIFLRARRWAGDPRRDPMATSECLQARGMFYEYDFGGRVYCGHHE